MVELESPSAAPYLADGTESRTMRLAMKQIRDWDIWAELNSFRFREELISELGRAHTAIRGAIRIERQCARIALRDPDMYLARHFSIVIGRRSMLTDDDRRRRSHTARQLPGLDIATYDRFIDIAEKDAAREAEWRDYMRSRAV
jgi:hypothetical protein